MYYDIQINIRLNKTSVMHLQNQKPKFYFKKLNYTTFMLKSFGAFQVDAWDEGSFPTSL